MMPLTSQYYSSCVKFSDSKSMCEYPHLECSTQPGEIKPGT